MSKSELVFNFLGGLSFLCWSFLGFYSAFTDDFSVVRISSSLLNGCIGVLFITRRRATLEGPLKANLISLPSLFIGGAMFKLAQPLSNWSNFLEIIFILGVISAILSFLYLGKNFSILPSLRAITANGPYKLVRHPCYTSELILVLCCFMAKASASTFILLILFLYTLKLRIDEEEKLLSKSNTYISYMKQVKWKLIPYIL